MTDAIDKAAFIEQLETDAESVVDVAKDKTEAGEYETVMGAILEEAEEVVTHHNWFARDYYGGSLYGAIIEHTETNVSTFEDWEVACDEVDPKRALKSLAKRCYLAELSDEAQRRAG